MAAEQEMDLEELLVRAIIASQKEMGIHQHNGEAIKAQLFKKISLKAIRLNDPKNRILFDLDSAEVYRKVTSQLSVTLSLFRRNKKLINAANSRNFSDKQIDEIINPTDYLSETQ